MLNKLIAIACLVLLSSCIDDETTTSEAEFDSLFADTVVAHTNTADSYLLPGINYSWQGNLDGKYPVLIWYKEIDGVITGSLFYTDTKNPDPILLAGTKRGDSIELVEYLNDGMITGVWVLVPGRHSIEGRWVDPIKDVELSVSLMKIDSAVTIHGLHKGRNVSGEYHYFYKDDDAPIGYLSVQQIDDDRVVVRFNNVGNGPAHNIGTISTDTIMLEGNKAAFSTEEYGGCELVIRFFDQFVHVSYKDNKVDCGLGHGVYLSGAYVKLH